MAIASGGGSDTVDSNSINDSVFGSVAVSNSGSDSSSINGSVDVSISGSLTISLAVEDTARTWRLLPCIWLESGVVSTRCRFDGVGFDACDDIVGFDDCDGTIGVDDCFEASGRFFIELEADDDDDDDDDDNDVIF